MNPVHHIADDNVNCLKYRFKQVLECIQKRCNGFINAVPDSHNGVVNGLEYCGNHCVNGINNIAEKGVDSSPDVDEKISDTRNYFGKKRGNTRPGVHKEVPDRSPDLVPACAEPTQHHICNTFQGIQNVGKGRYNKVPDGSKYAFDTVPQLIPVAGKQTNKYIQQSQNDARDFRENICNVLKYALKHRCKEITQRIPCCFQHIGEAFKVESKRIDTVGDALRQTGKCTFDLFPDAENIVFEILICFP